MRKLTLKQQIFVRAFLNRGSSTFGNATQSALEAYDTNYQTARVIGYENIRKATIHASIEELFQKQGLSISKQLDDLSTIAFADSQASLTVAHKLRAIELLFKIRGFL